MEARLQGPRFLRGLAISKSLAIGKSFEDMVVIFLIRYMTTLRASTWGMFHSHDPGLGCRCRDEEWVVRFLDDSNGRYEG